MCQRVTSLRYFGIISFNFLPTSKTARNEQYVGLYTTDYRDNSDKCISASCYVLIVYEILVNSVRSTK